MKLNRDDIYVATFVHCLDEADIIQQTTSGRKFYRLKNFLGDLGYIVKSVELIN